MESLSELIHGTKKPVYGEAPKYQPFLGLAKLLQESRLDGQRTKGE